MSVKFHHLQVKPGKKVNLAEWDADATDPFSDKKKAQALLEKNLEGLWKQQELLYAGNTHAVLIVLQAMDAGGKDGTIRHVMRGLNPQGCRVTSFKAPSKEELSHDFLWRIHKEIPRCGEIGIFNRSHYEDVLVVRVHELVPKSIWRQRFGEINAFEKYLTDNGVVILKFFLHISRSEQEKRIRDRMDDTSKNWKLTPEDFKERNFWNDYMLAYEEVLSKCSTPYAPWYIIPANKKWFRNLSVSQIIHDHLKKLHLQFPPLRMDLSSIKLD
jgi:PPK2 family polyphosphate:nucleotide phosphotransferase